jgi:hypothetical protein
VQGKRCFEDKYQIYQKEINFIHRDNFRMKKCVCRNSFQYITERKFNLFSEIQRVSDRNAAQNKITKRIELHAQK